VLFNYHMAVQPGFSMLVVANTERKQVCVCVQVCVFWGAQQASLHSISEANHADVRECVCALPNSYQEHGLLC
jgi:hypothetical protein